MPDVHSVLPFVKKERIILQYFLIPVNKRPTQLAIWICLLSEYQGD